MSQQWWCPPLDQLVKAVVLQSSLSWGSVSKKFPVSYSLYQRQWHYFPVYVYSLTFSSVLTKISLSGKAPSSCIHWSRTSCGSESSSLTGITKEPIGWSHALDNYRDKNTCTHDVSLCLFRFSILLYLIFWDKQYVHLYYEYLISGVPNRKVERLIPLRWSGAIAHLQTEKDTNGNNGRSSNHFKP